MNYKLELSAFISTQKQERNDNQQVTIVNQRRRWKGFCQILPPQLHIFNTHKTGLVSLKTWFTTFVQSNPYPAENIPNSTAYMSWVNFWANFGSVCDFSADSDSPYGCGGRPGRPYGSHTWNLGLANHWVVGRPLLGGSPAYVTLLYHQHHSWSLCSRPLFQARSMNRTFW